MRSGRCFDLIVAGGRVVDPAGAGVLDADVGVRDGRIAAVAPALERVGAVIVDAAGLLVVPGLVDLHTHVVPFTYWGVDPDPLAARSGVTTWVDAGSAGAYGIDGLRHDVAARCTARVRTFLNISSIGLAAPSFELANRAYLEGAYPGHRAQRWIDVDSWYGARRRPARAGHGCGSGPRQLSLPMRTWQRQGRVVIRCARLVSMR